MSSQSSGLVQRRTAKPSSDSNGPSTSASTSDFNGDFKDEASGENMEESSDKETRLTLMEEVLLLGLKDKEVSPARLFVSVIESNKPKKSPEDQSNL